MAPRLPESFESFATRLPSALAQGQTEVRFGGHHFSHAVCLEAGVFRVRRLETTKEEAEAYLAEHGLFMPEHNEAIAKPRTLVFEAASLDELLATLKQRWPLWAV